MPDAAKMPDELLLEDEIDRLIRRFGKPAVMAEFERRKRHHAKRGAKPQKNAVYLLEMARIIHSYPGQKRPQIGRIAGIIADRQKPKSRCEHEALIKTWKRQFLRHQHLLRLVELITSSPQVAQVGIMRYLEERLRRLHEEEARDYYLSREEEGEEEARNLH
jgi:hypothetical protein